MPTIRSTNANDLDRLDDIDCLDLDRLKDSFARGLPLPTGVEAHLRDSLLQVLHTPGSLARPQIVLQMAETYGRTPQHGRDLAIALEYFHTASLLFDDLPCMDNAAERRGRPCVHLVHGESGAILAALTLVNRAYSLLWQAVAECPPALQSSALKYVERNLGVDGLLNGQSLDLHYGSLPHTRETTECIALGKTVSLIRLALVLPAQLGGAGQHELHLLDRIAVFWGLSYQILDDLKDVVQTSEQSGKTAARDAQLDRPNIALILGVEPALARLARLVRLGDRSLHTLLKIRPSLAFLKKLHADLEQESGRLSLHACLTAAGGAA